MNTHHVKKEQKKSILKKFIISFISIVMIPVSLYFYATEIERKLITVTWNEIEAPTIPKEFNNKKILQFSDVHLGPEFTLKQLENLVEKMNELHPDIVVFTGDLIDKFGSYSAEKDEAKVILQKINAPLGKYAVFGNHDRGGGGSVFYKKYMEEAGFSVLVNEVQKIEVGNGKYITISGLDDFLLGKPQIAATLKHVRQQDFNMLLVHEPDVVDKVACYPVDFQVSGHSHGGQVQIPFIGPLITTKLAESYVEGMYELEGKNKPLHLYVNRGIGTTRMPVRFWSVPELSVFVLKQNSN
ncbi:TPA: metallophosphoesterase [Bacillus toyonensis]|uniref:metallophosphoesterase n=1 Tax=Bacillus cereus group TaxID=86661 RepID=UPI000B4536BB|nr:metallophosphoesterase [Bacillus toyonensis]OTX07723.1 metallophosphoesterase [Bacillus thuringiensis serovar seoulensis]QPW47424.1 metallophosphoesterase [Bacillus thuringiensis]MDO8159760.1 metallophosphoesterase [Bacillus toyonensis]MED3198464.1 metallophosphoesterase [Bacillus toyonensis]MED3542070.1 metallophosphoesterase [Bacillus toyonensis]